ncbi:hypothetical protein JS578_09210 [Dysgonomonadaceae bacterium zrk40]|nr:hypothetical protein JS578_09210 [Dysgonomonadaceae bacterium zrk40]
MRKLSLLFTLLILASFFIQCNRKTDGRLNDRLTEMAKELNESAPVMLDPYTRFDEASVTGDNHFRYRYSVLNTKNPDSLLSERLATLTDNIRTMFSTNEELAIFRENSVVLEYVYNNEQQQLLRTITINPEDYQ